jgi:hypothetical protein
LASNLVPKPVRGSPTVQVNDNGDGTISLYTTATGIKIITGGSGIDVKNPTGPNVTISVDGTDVVILDQSLLEFRDNFRKLLVYLVTQVKIDIPPGLEEEFLRAFEAYNP